MTNKNSPARIAANNRYNEKAYDRINIAIPKGRKETIESRAKSQGKSMNGYIISLIQNDLAMTDEEWKANESEIKERG